MTTPNPEEIKLLMAKAQQMLTVAADNLALGHYDTAVNRSYYAVFHAATALLLSIGESRAKHHGVLSAFRQYFIKPGLWPVEYSEIHGDTMQDRTKSDYGPFIPMSVVDAEDNLQKATRFVNKTESWLQEKGHL